MNISGIRPSSGFYDQNSIRFKQELGLDITEDSKAAEDNGTVAEGYQVQLTDKAVEEARKNQTFGSYDFASQYKPGEAHELKGADSDLKKLDVEKAVSDMKKDTAIHRYQYFVQSKKTEGGNSQQVRGTEDFSL